MEAKTIVAIEIGSSKIKGAVGAVAPDGRLSVLALESVPSSDNVRYGRVQNIREVSAIVNDIICRLEDAPAVAPRRVRALAVSLGGRSLAGVPAHASIPFAKECEITEKQVQRLIYEATRDYVGDKHIEATVPRTFFVNNTAVRQPVGIFGDTLSGDFVMICCARETRQNLDRIKYDRVESADVSYIVRPLAVADLVLTPDEKKLGTALVDFGSETTTIAVYKNGGLAFVCTIPMGSRLITSDLKSGLGITEEAAEALKMNIAANPDGASDLEWGYIHSRAGEIAANVMAQLDGAGFGADQITKIVLTGGGARLGEFGNQLTALSKLSVRVAEMPSDIVFRVAGCNNPDNIDIVAILAAAAKKMPESCLTAITPSAVPEPEPEPVAAAEAEEEPQLEGFVTPEPEPATPRVLDDDDLLKDDEDDPIDEPTPTPQPAKKRRLWPFGAKAKAPVPEPVNQPEPEPEADDYIDDDTVGGDDEPEDEDDIFGPEKPEAPQPPKGPSTIDNIRNTLLRLFTPPDETDDDTYNDR